MVSVFVLVCKLDLRVKAKYTNESIRYLLMTTSTSTLAVVASACDLILDRADTLNLNLEARNAIANHTSLPLFFSLLPPGISQERHPYVLRSFEICKDEICARFRR